MIKKRLSYIALATLVCVAPAAQAKDACKTVLCMWGKLKGEFSAECEPPVQDYFDIVKRKHGKIKWSSTSSARQQFLDSCPEADRGATKKINDKFGKARG
ncbi:TrbM/KikA/MpfK family conjugal transfer protein [Pseudomonas sp. PDM20]|uniref:TrbM/KikA/MpfK family conjugal transfer protein n=1 Tax=Pseudomonas sp. PDM20 TaxID=2769254 RepID=UPI0017875836|nr:TrbM/KikA/MpfK family conjugal transfer protein [Pseudomonas sp. PDM20]MBD9686851.1 killer protein [Pseudomonas sp. PDM20]